MVERLPQVREVVDSRSGRTKYDTIGASQLGIQYHDDRTRVILPYCRPHSTLPNNIILAPIQPVHTEVRSSWNRIGFGYWLMNYTGISDKTLGYIIWRKYILPLLGCTLLLHRSIIHTITLTTAAMAQIGLARRTVFRAMLFFSTDAVIDTILVLFITRRYSYMYVCDVVRQLVCQWGMSACKYWWRSNVAGTRIVNIYSRWPTILCRCQIPK